MFSYLDEDATIAWCRNLFSTLKHGSIWVVPRSGMIFRRHGEALIWVGTIPPEMKGRAEDLHKQEFSDVGTMFGIAGIEVRRDKQLRQFESAESARRFYTPNSRISRIEQDKPWNNEKED